MKEKISKKQENYILKRREYDLQNQIATRHQRRIISSLHHSIIKNAPNNIIDKYKSLMFREKLFIAYIFESSTLTEAALKCGYPPNIAMKKGAFLKKKLQDILEYVEDNIVCSITSTVLDNNIICREAIVEKLTQMLMPNVGDFEDFEEAKKNGLLAAVKEMNQIELHNKQGDKIGVKKTVKLVDQIAVIKTLNEMLGYNAPRKKELDTNANNIPPNINVTYIAVDPNKKIEKQVQPIEIENEDK